MLCSLLFLTPLRSSYCPHDPVITHPQSAFSPCSCYVPCLMFLCSALFFILKHHQSVLNEIIYSVLVLKTVLLSHQECTAGYELVCMYVCMCVYVCVYVCVYMCVYVCVWGGVLW